MDIEITNEEFSQFAERFLADLIREKVVVRQVRLVDNGCTIHGRFGILRIGWTLQTRFRISASGKKLGFDFGALPDIESSLPHFVVNLLGSSVAEIQKALFASVSNRIENKPWLTFDENVLWIDLEKYAQSNGLGKWSVHMTGSADGSVLRLNL